MPGASQVMQGQTQHQYNNNIPYDNYYYQPEVEPFSVKSETKPATPYSPAPYSTPHPAVMGHDLPLPQIPNTIMEEDHNVGSLLRLVYSCPDQLEAGQEYSQQTAAHAGQPSSHNSQSMNTRPSICQSHDLTPSSIDYPLDGTMAALDYLL